MNPKKLATPAHPVQDLITQRWSPYAFSDRPVSEDDLRSLFEAARWAASSYNEQPWRYIVATKAAPAEFERLLSCLVEGNQAWAKAAPVLALGCISLNFVLNCRPNSAAEHDLGLASATLTLEATARGLVVHQMIGILPEKARELLPRPGRFPAADRPGDRLRREPRHAPGESPPARSGARDPQAARRVRLRRPMGNAVRPREMKLPPATRPLS